MHEEDESPAVEHQYTFHPNDSAAGTRLDQFVAMSVADLSRSHARSLIDSNMVLVDGMARKASFKVSAGETVVVDIPETVPMELLPEAIPIDVLYEDDDVIVINKAAGMVVHPAPGHPAGTLVNALLHYAPDISIAGNARPGIVHRLDKDTSGVMIVARNDRASQSLVEQWASGKVRKRYLTVVSGRVNEEEAIIDVPIARHRTDRKRMAVDRNGKAAVTQFTVLERFDEASLLDVDLRTGRTHQIRVHMTYVKHPIIGDGVYGNATSASLSQALGVRRQMLHAFSLGFALPGTGKTMELVAQLPPDMDAVIERLRGGKELT